MHRVGAQRKEAGLRLQTGPRTRLSFPIFQQPNIHICEYVYFQIRLWNPENGTQIGPVLRGHTQWVMALAWRPLHLYAFRNRFLVLGLFTIPI